MRVRNRFLGLVRGSVALFAIAMMSTFAQADVILCVDLSVENQVTITGTAGLSSATISGSDGTGVYLDNFYGVAGGALAETLVTGDITNLGNPTDNSPDLFRGGAGTDTGLNMWSWSSDVTVDFTAGTQAFTGSGTWTLSAAEYADMLAGNSFGDIYFPADTQDDIAGATVIGEYKVITAVPEPGSLSVIAIGLGALALRRRRR